jgi:hypothetical protein
MATGCRVHPMPQMPEPYVIYSMCSMGCRYEYAVVKYVFKVSNLEYIIAQMFEGQTYLQGCCCSSSVWLQVCEQTCVIVTAVAVCILARTPDLKAAKYLRIGVCSVVHTKASKD